jgi:hypothetical protein
VIPLPIICRIALAIRGSFDIENSTSSAALTLNGRSFMKMETASFLAIDIPKMLWTRHIEKEIYRQKLCNWWAKFG